MALFGLFGSKKKDEPQSTQQSGAETQNVQAPQASGASEGGAPRPAAQKEGDKDKNVCEFC